MAKSSKAALALNARNQCWPEGVPFILTNVGMQMVQQPDKITILYADTYEVRRVRMDQPHPAHVTPSWYGDSTALPMFAGRGTIGFFVLIRQA